MGRRKQFKMKESGHGWLEDVKCPLCQKVTKASDIKVYGNESGRLLALKCGHRLFQ